jgi:hypothetical protein
MRVFAGHIKKETATRLGFDVVKLSIIDTSGRGRGETRYFCQPFENMNNSIKLVTTNIQPPSGGFLLSDQFKALFSDFF